MDSSFTTAYKSLNTRQKQAVDTTEGAILVLAGPGTGKTQLLSTRAANIVRQGNVSASNILCLTFTEAGASEMRERITKIMGVEGGDVAVHTFHSFGTWIINQYPTYFAPLKALSPLDDLGRFHILETLLGELPLRHPLAVRDQNDRFIRQNAVREAIQKFKEAGLTPDQLRVIMAENAQTLSKLEPLLTDIFALKLGAKRLPDIAALLASYTATDSLGSILLESLHDAVDASIDAGKTKPLGDWRSKYTTTLNGIRVFKSTSTAKLFGHTIDLYELYQQQLAKLSRYDYVDMILWATDALKDNDDMRLDVAERYQYIMVDEYQDTNGAQGRLIDTILDASIDSPNVLVVGDDDQAIMRFQGAEVSGMMQFIEQYQPQVIVLTDNYRSTQPILDAARNVITQTDERLETLAPQLNITKQLISHSTHKTTLEHRSYVSPTAQYAAVATAAKKLLDGGVPASEIAVIGRKHAELSLVVPFMTMQGLRVAYDGKQSLLDKPVINHLLQLAILVQTLATKPVRAQNHLPTVLAAPYWQLSPLAIYKLAATARMTKTTWLDSMLESEDEHLVYIAEWLIAAANATHTQNFTQMLDILLGRIELGNTQLKLSPFSQYLTKTHNEAYATLLSNLIALRSAVLTSRPNATGLSDLIEVANDYRRSETRLVDDNPLLHADANSIQLMSAHGAKGREFSYVFVLSALENVWGPRAKANNNRIRLPENLPLYPPGDTNADKLRLLYVAMTRAKHNLVIMSYSQTDEGKSTTNLSYLNLEWALPQPQKLPSKSKEATLEAAWSLPAAIMDRPLQQVLDPLLKKFAMSASSLKNFLDFTYSGPLTTIEHDILKFPSAHNVHSALGSASHETLLVAHTAAINGQSFSHEEILHTFDAQLDKSGLSSSELMGVRNHGHQFLPAFIDYFKPQFASITATEKFVSGRLSNGIALSGAIDAIAENGNQLTVIDYKTGTPPASWDTKGAKDSLQRKLHFYRQQLLFYKLLLENCPAFNGKTVTCAKLVFVEPHPDSGEFITLTIDQFDPIEVTELEALIVAVYNRIMSLDLPDTSVYKKSLAGVLHFETNLRSDNS